VLVELRRASGCRFGCRRLSWFNRIGAEQGHQQFGLASVRTGQLCRLPARRMSGRGLRARRRNLTPQAPDAGQAANRRALCLPQTRSHPPIRRVPRILAHFPVVSHERNAYRSHRALLECGHLP
jgi:hypothetical protein